MCETMRVLTLKWEGHPSEMCETMPVVTLKWEGHPSEMSDAMSMETLKWGGCLSEIWDRMPVATLKWEGRLSAMSYSEFYSTSNLFSTRWRMETSCHNGDLWTCLFRRFIPSLSTIWDSNGLVRYLRIFSTRWRMEIYSQNDDLCHFF
jgi:hypothetical protein